MSDGQQTAWSEGFGRLRVAVVFAVTVALLAAGCASASGPVAQPEPQLQSDLVDERPTTTDKSTSTADSVDTGPGEPVSLAATRGDAIEQLLVSYTEAINDRRAEDAYDLFTDDLKDRVPREDLVDGTSTSFISRLSVAQVAFDQPDEASVIASFRTDQAPELGRDGQSCSIWELEYRLIDVSGDVETAGRWLIDQAAPLGGSPFPCPVVVPEPEDQEPVEPPSPGSRRVVHLTLDDGPGPETERFLDLFAEFGVVATFFVNSNRIDGRTAVVQRIVKDGHAIANHTHSHCNLQNPDALTPSALCRDRTAADEIEDAQRIISEVTGVTPRCFRPPYGAQSARTRALIEGYGLANWLWDIDTNDWRFNANNADYSEAQAVAELDKAATIRPRHGSEGVIVLLHDGTGSAPRMLRLLRAWLDANADRFDFKALDGC